MKQRKSNFLFCYASSPNNFPLAHATHYLRTQKLCIVITEWPKMKSIVVIIIVLSEKETKNQLAVYLFRHFYFFKHFTIKRLALGGFKPGLNVMNKF